MSIEVCLRTYPNKARATPGASFDSSQRVKSA